MIHWLLIGLMNLHPGIKPPDVVTVHVNKSIVYAGESNSIEIGVNVKEGYHIQANKVKDELLIPTTLEVKNNEFLSASKLEFPPSKQFKLAGTDSSLLVFDGKFLIKLFFSSSMNARFGKYDLMARLRYQACDSSSCFFPRTIDFSIPIEVKARK